MLHYGARYFDYSDIHVTYEIGTSSKFSGVMPLSWFRSCWIAIEESLLIPWREERPIRGFLEGHFKSSRETTSFFDAAQVKR